MVLDSIFTAITGGLNVMLSPLLKLPSLWVVFIISLIASFIASIIYKYTTDQKLMKRLKEEQKELQIQARKEKGPKAFEFQKKAMKISFEQMMHSMRSTLFTFFPLVLIFIWLSANLSYMPINPGVEFTTAMVFEPGVSGTAEIIVPEGMQATGSSAAAINTSEKYGIAEWALKGNKGEYIIEYRFNDKSYTKEVLITEEQAYKTVAEKINRDGVMEIRLNNRDNKFINIGFIKMGWLASYLIFSIVFSLSLRKVMNLY